MDEHLNETNLGENIRYLRKLKKWSQQDLAEKLSCRQTMIANYESNYRKPSTKRLILLANLFGVNYDQLFGKKANRKKDPKKHSKLWDRFEEADKLPPQDKTVLIKMIDGLLSQRKTNKKQLT
jgi:transcriptional regulator with XRE-family HTH domain